MRTHSTGVFRTCERLGLVPPRLVARVSAFYFWLGNQPAVGCPVIICYLMVGSERVTVIDPLVNGSGPRHSPVTRMASPWS